MSTLLRRFELLLPLRFNDGQPVPESLIAESISELEKQFGSVSCETQVIRGQWRHQGLSYRDELVRVFVDVVDSAECRDFFIGFKENLKIRFGQIDIWMTTYLVEVI